MFAKKIFSVLVLTCFLVPAAQAQATDDIKGYFSETASEVKAVADPAEKRAILGTRLQRMSTALDKVERSGLVSQEDLASLEGFRSSLQEKQDELAGNNGFSPVPNSQLDFFADYVVQDMEQAERTVTIGVVTALLILIIVILVT